MLLKFHIIRGHPNGVLVEEDSGMGRSGQATAIVNCLCRVTPSTRSPPTCPSGRINLIRARATTHQPFTSQALHTLFIATYTREKQKETSANQGRL